MEIFFASILMCHLSTISSTENIADYEAELQRGKLRRALASQHEVPLVRLTRDLLSAERYDTRVRPIHNHTLAIKIHLSMSLYQIIEVNEPSQNIQMNVWMIQKWVDELLGWDPREYGMINSTILPHSSVWIPDTYLYNSVVMSREETERYMNIRVDTLHWEGKRGAQMSFLYPAIYTITCRLNIRYFPYDQQNCTLTISSWTNSKTALDYSADDFVNLQSYIRNEEWDVITFKIYRHEYYYACCPEPWVVLEASLVIRRKPLYYVVNLIIPTSIITTVAIMGFFTPASTSDDRTEKINLGITTLLAMSILMLMVSDQMPTTSEFVPLIAWFYLSIIVIVSIGTFLTSIVLSVQSRRQYGRLPSTSVRIIFFLKFASWFFVAVPPQLVQLWEELDDHPSVAQDKKSKKPIGMETLGNGQNRCVKEQKVASLKTDLITDVPRTLLMEGNTQQVTMNKNGTSSCTGTTKSLSSKSHWLKIALHTGAKMDCEGSAGTNAALSTLGLPKQSAKNSPMSPHPVRSRKGSLWESAMVLAGVGEDKFLKDNAASPEILLMKRRRQCALEWEFLATILDRILLILFLLCVFIITLGLVVTGRMAQHSYDQFEA